MFCPKCGATLKPNARFCTKCGYKLKVPVPPAEESMAYERKDPLDILDEEDLPDDQDDIYETDVPDEASGDPVPSRRDAGKPGYNNAYKGRGGRTQERGAGSGKGLKPVLLIVPLIAILAVAFLFGRNLIGNKTQKAERAGISQQEKASEMNGRETVEEQEEDAAADAPGETVPPEVTENIEQEEDAVPEENAGTEAEKKTGAEEAKKTPDADQRYVGWLQEPGGWRYYNGDGSCQTGEWFEDEDHRWYYFDDEGYMMADTLTPDGFRLGPDGAMITESQAAAQPAAANTPAFGTGTALPASSSTPASGTGTALPAAGDARATDGFMIPDSSTRYISASDLQGFTEWEARVARNEIYARHGRKFNSGELQQWFNSQSWYKGTVSPNSFNENVLNAVEKANIKTIEQYEKRF